MASSRSHIAAVFRIFLLTLIKATLRSNNLNDKILFYLRGFEERLWSLRAAVWFISEDYSLIIYIFFCGRIFGWWVLSGWGSEMICVCFPILVSRVFFLCSSELMWCYSLKELREATRRGMTAVPKHSLSEPSVAGASVCSRADLVLQCSGGAQQIFQRLLPVSFIFGTNWGMLRSSIHVLCRLCNAFFPGKSSRNCYQAVVPLCIPWGRAHTASFQSADRISAATWGSRTCSLFRVLWWRGSSVGCSPLSWRETSCCSVNSMAGCCCFVCFNKIR